MKVYGISEMSRKAVILVNTGTPASPSRRDVARFLREFLSDPEVIDMNPLARWLLVNILIVPLRSFRSAAMYRRLWKPEGSPLRISLENIVERLNSRSEMVSGDQGVQYYGAMRYGTPSVAEVFHEIIGENYESVVVLPLFPQSASSTTGSVRKLVKSIAADTGRRVTVLGEFFMAPAYYKTIAGMIGDRRGSGDDMIVFSYHGIPERHLLKQDKRCIPGTCSCDHSGIHEARCYRSACYMTSALVAEAAGLGKEGYITTFQSRFGRRWLKPYTRDKLVELARNGHKRIIIVSPSFVSDCLETTIEIGFEYDRLFRKEGGEELVIIPALNQDLDVEGIIGFAEKS